MNGLLILQTRNWSKMCLSLGRKSRRERPLLSWGRVASWPSRPDSGMSGVWLLRLLLGSILLIRVRRCLMRGRRRFVLRLGLKYVSPHSKTQMFNMVYSVVDVVTDNPPGWSSSNSTPQPPYQPLRFIPRTNSNRLRQQSNLRKLLYCFPERHARIRSTRNWHPTL